MQSFSCQVELLASEKRLQEEVSELTQNLRKKEKDLETAQKRAAGLSDDEISAQLAAEKKLNEQIKEELQVTLIMICSGGLFISTDPHSTCIIS